MKKIAIFSLTYNNWNFGGMLQSYALEQVVDSLGYESEHVRISLIEQDYSSINKSIKSIASYFRIGTEVIDRFYFYKNGDQRDLKEFREFQKSYIKLKGYYNSRNIGKVVGKYDAFIVGSDQVWNVEYFGKQVLDLFGLCFVPKHKKKIAYAISVGNENTIEDNLEQYEKMINGIDAVSVRENTTGLCFEKFMMKKIATVLDPTFLLVKAEWEMLMEKFASKEKYVFSYFLKGDAKNVECIKQVIGSLGLRHYCVSDEIGKYVDDMQEQIGNFGPRQFLGAVHDADIIVTNSFHCVVFAIIFHKRFWVVNRFSELSVSDNRIRDLLGLLGLEKRIINQHCDKDYNGEDIDYDGVDLALKQYINQSKDWLKKALEEIG